MVPTHLDTWHSNTPHACLLIINSFQVSLRRPTSSSAKINVRMDVHKQTSVPT